MPPLSFSDEELAALTTLAALLPPPLRSVFLQAVADKLAAYLSARSWRRASDRDCRAARLFAGRHGRRRS